MERLSSLGKLFLDHWQAIKSNIFVDIIQKGITIWKVSIWEKKQYMTNSINMFLFRLNYCDTKSNIRHILMIYPTKFFLRFVIIWLRQMYSKHFMIVTIVHFLAYPIIEKTSIWPNILIRILNFFSHYSPKNIFDLQHWLLVIIDCRRRSRCLPMPATYHCTSDLLMFTIYH